MENNVTLRKRPCRRANKARVAIGHTNGNIKNQAPPTKRIVPKGLNSFMLRIIRFSVEIETISYTRIGHMMG